MKINLYYSIFSNGTKLFLHTSLLFSKKSIFCTNNTNINVILELLINKIENRYWNYESIFVLNGHKYEHNNFHNNFEKRVLFRL